MDIFDRLTDDHGKQKGLAAGLTDTSGDSAERRRLFAALKEELETHAAAEEQVFYAELIAKPEGQSKARHSIAEHKKASDLIEQLEGNDMSSPGWLQTFSKLQHEIVHHVEEEERDVFPLARTLIGDERATDMAREFDERKSAEAA